MRLLVAAVGRLPRGPERALVERYQERIAQLERAVRVGPAQLIEVEARGADAKAGGKQRIAAEAALLAKAAAPAERLVALDERGAHIGSAEFADLLGSWRDRGVGSVGFLLGGADGLQPELRGQAAQTLSFGAFTWPHALARVLLFEQLYRAAALLAGHPYHRE